MTVLDAVLSAMEDVLGIEKDELVDNLDMDLFENGIVDSLAIVVLVNEIEKLLNKSISIKEISPSEFVTINKLTAAIKAQIGE